MRNSMKTVFSYRTPARSATAYVLSDNPTFEEDREVYPFSMTDLQRSHEEGFVRAFIEKSKQDRCISFLTSAKHRRKFTGELAHFKGLDERFSQPVPAKTAHTVK